MTIKEYLQNIVDELNSQGDKEYILNCFMYPVIYELYGTKHDFPLGSKGPYLEGVVAITTKDFETENMYQGYLCYPEEHPKFYEEGNFILCYGPSKEIKDFDSFLEETIDDFELYTEFYGLEDKEFSPKALQKKNH